MCCCFRPEAATPGRREAAGAGPTHRAPPSPARPRPPRRTPRRLPAAPRRFLPRRFLPRPRVPGTLCPLSPRARRLGPWRPRRSGPTGRAAGPSDAPGSRPLPARSPPGKPKPESPRSPGLPHKEERPPRAESPAHVPPRTPPGPTERCEGSAPLLEDAGTREGTPSRFAPPRPARRPRPRVLLPARDNLPDLARSSRHPPCAADASGTCGPGGAGPARAAERRAGAAPSTPRAESGPRTFPDAGLPPAAPQSLPPRSS
ncbi:proline-rich protein 2-like [Enhydra lutris kenyoni]|uniref:Proline-rich protein 2-like n=1 Tax=Enhydra lutris kenyoni TaxID=391180 RepID=A0A2Y9K0A9_ENHLU|nr:proline-rich protein 2-like [Enhydra lutris kenyoni]